MAQTEEKFNSLTELYNRLLPALKVKCEELAKEKLKVEANDIWAYCLKCKWQSRKDLRIYELVDDILNVDAYKISLFLKNKYNYEEL